MKQIIVKSFLLIYKKIIKRNFLRNLIKRLINNDKIIVNYNNFKVQAGIKTALESDVIFGSYNELMILKLISGYSEKGFCFLDVGANVGLHTLTAATSNSDIEIYSFEPEPNNYQNLIKNISLNECFNVRPFKMGLGNISENKVLNIN